MMTLSRAWYGALALVVVLALAAAYGATGAFNTQLATALTAQVDADAQTISTELKLDARHRLDKLVAGGADAAIAQTLATANGSKTPSLPVATRLSGRKALQSLREGLGADDRGDAVFLVDRDGRVIAQAGYDAVATNEEFELGGYPAVADALRGWARDDTWQLGSSLYLVTACPADYEPGQGPAGALVELKEINAKFAEGLAHRTGTALTFYVGTEGIASGATDSFDKTKVKVPGSLIKEMVDQTASGQGRASARMLTDDVGAAFTRLPGATWSSAAGFAVLRTLERASGPSALLGRGGPGAIPWFTLLFFALIAAAVGVFLSILENTIPLRQLLKQSARLKYGGIQRIDGQRTQGSLRALVDDVNGALDRMDAEFSARAAHTTTRQRKLPPLAGAGGDGPMSKAPRSTAAAVKDMPSSTGSTRGGEVPSRTPPAGGGIELPSKTPPPMGEVPSRTPPPASARREKDDDAGASRGASKNGAAAHVEQPEPAMPEPSNTLVLRKSSPDIDPETMSLPRVASPPAAPGKAGPSEPAPASKPGEAETTLNSTGKPAAPRLATPGAPAAATPAAATPAAAKPASAAPPAAKPASAAPPAAKPPAAVAPSVRAPAVPTPSVRAPAAATPSVRAPAVATPAARAPAAASASSSPPPDHRDAEEKGSETMHAAAPRELLDSLMADLEEGATPLKNMHGDVTAVLAASPELLEAAGLTIRASAELTPGMAQEAQQWKKTFDDYVGLKKERGEPVDGLTFDKFVELLRKNRDAIVASHKCKAVKFSVALTNGKVTLKAAPVN
jgi:hypothetical protein